MAAITNRTNIPMGLAVWLLHDDYDYVDAENYISVTGLMKPVRHIVLPRRIPAEKRLVPDVKDYISRAIGHSLHDSIEKAWINSYQKSLKLMGYSDKVIDRVLINPTPEQLAAVEHPIPVYLEQRALKQIVVDGRLFTIGGKFDMVAEGIVHDNKSTTVYTWIYGGKDEDYKLQGSLYRWLNPDKITEDYIRINFIFTDWSKRDAQTNPNYPQERCLYKDIPLMSIEETEQWIIAKLRSVIRAMSQQEKDIVECTDEELWRSDPKYKYYLDPTKTGGRSTKNFDSLGEAKAYMTNEKGGKGVILTVPGEVKRCEYCDAFVACTQKDRYFQP